MERETKTITTPGGHSVVLKAFLTGREENELKALLYAELKMSATDVQAGRLSVSDIPASFIVKQEEKATELLTVSVDGSTENPAQKVLDLPSAEYDFVVREINAIRTPTTPQNSAQLWQAYFRSGAVEFDTQIIAILCKEMKWDYTTYMEQPTWFILMLLQLFHAEAAHSQSKL